VTGTGQYALEARPPVHRCNLSSVIGRSRTRLPVGGIRFAIPFCNRYPNHAAQYTIALRLHAGLGALNMVAKLGPTIGVLVLAVLVSVVIYFFIDAGTLRPCAPSREGAEQYQKTIAALDSIIDLGLKLATTLVGVGAAALIGFKSELKLSPSSRIVLLLAVICFLQSAFYAIKWRLAVAELWLNGCLDLISEPLLELRFLAHAYFFFGGLFWLALLLMGAVITARLADRGDV
jgi:hypothetical protein